MVLDVLAVDNFNFTRKIVKKIVKKIFSEKLVKMLGFCQNLIFGQKFDFSKSVEVYVFERNQSNHSKVIKNSSFIIPHMQIFFFFFSI